VKLSSILTESNGRMDKVVHYNRLGTQCVRRHVIPHNPDTEAQRENRSTFADAVKAWQLLPDEEKIYWNKKAAVLRRKGKKGKTGYIVFLSHYLKNPGERG
nr:hypothetical protein [Spirochaetota bacterium]